MDLELNRKTAQMVILKLKLLGQDQGKPYEELLINGESKVLQMI